MTGKHIWVEISIGIDNQERNFYYNCRMDLEVFHSVVGNQFKDGFVKVEDVCWHSKGKLYFLSDLDDEGTNMGLSNTMFIRVQDIRKITILDAAFVLKLGQA